MSSIYLCFLLANYYGEGPSGSIDLVGDGLIVFEFPLCVLNPY